MMNHLEREQDAMNEIIAAFDAVIESQKKIIEYNGYYIAHLLGQLSDDEFENISTDYSVSLNNDADDTVKRKLHVLLTHSSRTFSAVELSHAFGIKEELAEELLAAQPSTR